MPLSRELHRPSWRASSRSRPAGKWSDLYVGRSGREVLEEVRSAHAAAMKGLPFHVAGGSGGVAYEARQVARERNAAILLVSTTSRETRPGGDETIGIHRDRRQPSSLGRGNPGRLVLGGKETGDVERESDTVLVLAQEPWKSKRPSGKWTRVWCAVAKNRSGARAWCALRFNGTGFEVDREFAGPVEEAPAPEDEERALPEEE